MSDDGTVRIPCDNRPVMEAEPTPRQLFIAATAFYSAAAALFD